MPKRGGFGGFRKIGGAHIGQKAVKIYECNGCGLQHRMEAAAHPGQKLQKPTQCRACGRMDFNKIDSITEANRLGELRLLVSAGLITDLETQVRFPLMAHRSDGVGVKVGTYIADAVYFRDGLRVIEDSKPDNIMSDLASWKLRHMAAQGLPVTIVTPKGRK